MLSTTMRQIKAALWDQAFLGGTQVQCPMGQVMAVRRRKGQLFVLIRGWSRWYPVECVTIECGYAPSRFAHASRGERRVPMWHERL